ncbi:unnamed protein product [Periconia digitata]|uniref:Uncharacterized protein n=1 Tax=Periconia digitata TaxID=1303443 RepID=A0A9W4U734_9PLEO|nr:unnamed protein product [Periconia digitata]
MIFRVEVQRVKSQRIKNLALTLPHETISAWYPCKRPPCITTPADHRLVPAPADVETLSRLRADSLRIRRLCGGKHCCQALRLVHEFVNLFWHHCT